MYYFQFLLKNCRFSKFFKYITDKFHFLSIFCRFSDHHRKIKRLRIPHDSPLDQKHKPLKKLEHPNNPTDRK
jgi:hypothetical protein